MLQCPPASQADGAWLGRHGQAGSDRDRKSARELESPRGRGGPPPHGRRHLSFQISGSTYRGADSRDCCKHNPTRSPPAAAVALRKHCGHHCSCWLSLPSRDHYFMMAPSRGHSDRFANGLHAWFASSLHEVCQQYCFLASKFELHASSWFGFLSKLYAWFGLFA